ncbi:cytochrome c and c1 heme-lyase [Amniculicola lignicola CBS 123094]|uniref:Holocytochrome c-type synthase n=1 Tax=Amniculicola lignicola CBS 123094 TaxID=1392246 RepID=A0A6A5WYS2_9PLEO|nr:cytochrome c and c1 heme-lyase [Amniculicola lignicola CBS 123094]
MGEAEEKCPVDHKTREAWLRQARAQAGDATRPQTDDGAAATHSIPPTHSQTQTQAQTRPPTQAVSALQTPGCDSSQLDQTPSPPPATQAPQSLLSTLRLGTQREVSTIPRAATSPADPAPSRPANNEKDTGKDEKTGNWIYPSEEMFFNAMKRKGFGAQETDMQTIVPIHNAVNERAWGEIRGWEKGWGGESCGGPRLSSFSGLSTSLTPRARFNTLLGYQPPFDRHDWVVDRCGTKVEYVIDFYAGKNEGKPGKELNFYLDVRPKLNTWEGVKMRAARFVGL